MKFLSFNCRGFASSAKKLALRRLLISSQVDFIFLQETLSQAETLIHTLSTWFPSWTFQALDASGRSGGLAIGVNNRVVEIKNTFGGRGFIDLDINAHSAISDIRIINVYGPCNDRAIYWRALFESEIFQADNIILGGDLNFSLGYSESWGHSAQVDILTDTISGLLEEHHWVDIPSAKLQYTWTNNRSGEQSLARRLDRFLIKEHLVNEIPRV